MYQQSDAKQLYFQGLGPRKVVADFEGGMLSSDGGGLLLREVDLRERFVDEFARCFSDGRDRRYVEHSLRQMVAQRLYALALGYEDLNDHDQLRYDPLFAALCQSEDPQGNDRRRERDVGKALSNSTSLGRMERVGSAPDRYHKISCRKQKIREFFVGHFLKYYNEGQPPKWIVIDVDATDDELHGNQQGRFFHGYYRCYCYLPLYIFCGDHLLAAELRSSNIDASAGTDEELEPIVEQIRERWPQTQIIVRGDSSFAREWLMSWCEDHGVDYLFGLARNPRLRRRINPQMREAQAIHRRTREPARVFKDFRYRTLDTWSRARRVIGKAEYLPGGENPRFVVTSLSKGAWPAQKLYQELYCARGELENRVKEQQLYLFADRTSATMMATNQIRLWFSSAAYLLMNELRRVGLPDTELAHAQCDTIRLKLLKVGARVTVSVRRLVVNMATGYPHQALFGKALANIQAAFP
jgi:hypothetical protein